MYLWRINACIASLPGQWKPNRLGSFVDDRTYLTRVKVISDFNRSSAFVPLFWNRPRAYSHSRTRTTFAFCNLYWFCWFFIGFEVPIVNLLRKRPITGDVSGYSALKREPKQTAWCWLNKISTQCNLKYIRELWYLDVCTLVFCYFKAASSNNNWLRIVHTVFLNFNAPFEINVPSAMLRYKRPVRDRPVGAFIRIRGVGGLQINVTPSFPLTPGISLTVSSI